MGLYVSKFIHSLTSTNSFTILIYCRDLSQVHEKRARRSTLAQCCRGYKIQLDPHKLPTHTWFIMLESASKGRTTSA